MENSKYYSVCKRKNNSKRGYLLVNPRQAKHIPVNPKKFFSLTKKMAKAFNKAVDISKSKNILIIGFAETATALGLSFAENLLEDERTVNYITTTRESIEGEPYIDFKEEHSHATEQRLYMKNWYSMADEAEEIIFVEDEISTGKTIHNIVSQMRDCDLLNNSTKRRIKVVSVLNGMSDKALEQFEAYGVEFVYLERIDNSEYESIAAGIEPTAVYTYNFRDTFNSREAINKLGITLSNDIRLGVSVRRYLYELHTLTSVDMLKYLENIDYPSSAVFDVIGTEECMYPAIYFACLLKESMKRCRLKVKTHSTTRSPIAVSDDKGYAIKNCAELRSLYDKNRDTYLYNLSGKVTYAIIVSDGRDKDGLNSLIQALDYNGAESITMVQIGYDGERE